MTGDASLAHRELGWVPTVSFAELVAWSTLTFRELLPDGVSGAEIWGGPTRTRQSQVR